MKAIHHIFCYIFFTFLFVGSVNAHDLSFSDTSIFTSFQSESSIQQKARFNKIFAVDSKIELVPTSTLIDGYSYSVSKHLLSLHGLLTSSEYLCQLGKTRLLTFDHLSIKNSFKKVLLFPFHSFW